MSLKDKIKIPDFSYNKKWRVDWEYVVINFFKKLFRRK